MDIPQSVLEDLRGRLARTRSMDEVKDAGWDYGTNLAYLTGLMDYWQREFGERFFDFWSWTEMPRGGHFAALEEPGLFVEDVLTFFRGLR